MFSDFCGVLMRAFLQERIVPYSVLVCAGMIALPAALLATTIGAPSALAGRSGTSTHRRTASRYAGTPTARAAKMRGDKAQRASKVDDAIDDYKRAITLDPDYAKAQGSYVFAVVHRRFEKELQRGVRVTPKMLADAIQRQKMVTKRLIVAYTSIAERHPRSPVYPWVLGQLYSESRLELQERYCREAVRLDPDFGPGWRCLAHIALLRTDRSMALVDLRKAMKISPNQADLAVQYASMLNSDNQYHGPEIAALVERFPQSQGLATAMVESARNLTSAAATESALELLRNHPPASSNAVASRAADALYTTYLTDDLSKAATLAHDVATYHKKDTRWVTRAQVAKELLEAQRKIDNGHAIGALAELKSIKPEIQMFVASNLWYLTDAKALVAAGRTKDAVHELRSRFVAYPTNAALAAMVAYGAKLGESHAVVEDSIWRVLRANAKPAHAFTLKRLDRHGSVSLLDYRGEPVILDFWYPNCGPCRESFPYLNKVAVKFLHEGLTVLAINGVQAQQPFALPYLRGKGYRFVGLAGNREFARGVYGVLGFPTTFFIGPEGNILFRIHLYDDATEQSAEAAVQFMLTRADKT